MSLLAILVAVVVASVVQGILDVLLGVDHLPSIASKAGQQFWLLHLGLHPDMPEGVRYDARMRPDGRVEVCIER